MPNPTTWPSARRFVGTAKETTQGTAVTPITFTHPLANFDPEDKFVWLDDTANRGSMVEVYGRQQGPGNSELSLGGPMYPDGLGYWLNNILGDLTTTGASAPFTHAFSTLNSGVAQPGSLTVVDWQGPPAATKARQYAGVCLSELTIKGNAASSLIEWSGKGVGYLSQIIGVEPVSAPTAITPFAAWRMKLGVGGPASGGTLISYMDEWEFTISRKVNPEWTAQNSQNPFFIQRGEVSTSGNLHFSKPPDEAMFLPLINNTQPQVQLLATNGGVGAALTSLQYDSQVTAWDTSKINRGDEAVGYDVSWVGVANTTNAGASGGYSPCKVTLQNAVAAAIY